MGYEEGSGKDDFVRLLIKRGAKADIVNDVLETTALHEAALKGDPDLLKLVLLGVSDINIQNGDGSTALHIITEALLDADEEAIDSLIDCIGILLLFPGIKVNEEDMKGEATPLKYAADAGNAKAVELLLDFGADVQSSTNGGVRIADIILQNIPDFDPNKFNKVAKGRPLKKRALIEGAVPTIFGKTKSGNNLKVSLHASHSPRRSFATFPVVIQIVTNHPIPT